MAKWRKLCFLLFLFKITVLLYVLTENHNIPQMKSNKVINILYWTPMFGQFDFNLGLGMEIFKNCAYANCYTTYNRTELQEFDAILFHVVEYLPKVHGIPENRTQKQIYIASNQESPLNTPQYENLQNFYNWTMTYRLDSEILRPYGRIVKDITGYKLPTVAEIQAKPNRIAWFVSNCVTWSQRSRIAQKIAELYPVDVYGRCGNYSCPKSSDCYEMLEENYKYYLAFENSVCVDYATEKLYNVLKKNIVPIVYGGADYEKIAPEKSFISVNNFSSAKALVKHLKFLDENPREYLGYFTWKEKYTVDTSNEQTLCSLCEMLNESHAPNSHKDFDRWWRNETCLQNGKFIFN